MSKSNSKKPTKKLNNSSKSPQKHFLSLANKNSLFSQFDANALASKQANVFRYAVQLIQFDWCSSLKEVGSFEVLFGWSWTWGWVLVVILSRDLSFWLSFESHFEPKLKFFCWNLSFWDKFRTGFEVNFWDFKVLMLIFGLFKSCVG